MEMSPEVLRDICKKHEMYRTPQLNDALYCNLQGFRKIANLEPYTGLVSLFLDGNAIASLDGIPFLPHLRCLYLQQNVLSDLVGLELVPGLKTLNISNNAILNLSGLQHCSNLSTLMCSHNSLTGCESINALTHCKALSTVDLQENDLEADAVFGNLKELPHLGCLYLKGNAVAATTKQYRKTLICTFPRLTYLDDRPVFETERRCAEAWKRGGQEAEKAERQRMREEAVQLNEMAFESMQCIRKEGFQKRRQSLGLPDGDTDPFFELHADAVWQEEKEPQELVSARQQLKDRTSDAIVEEIAAEQEADSSKDAAADEEARLFLLESERVTERLRTNLTDLALPDQEAPQQTCTLQPALDAGIKQSCLSTLDCSEEPKQAVQTSMSDCTTSPIRAPLEPLPGLSSNTLDTSKAGKAPKKVSSRGSSFKFVEQKG